MRNIYTKIAWTVLYVFMLWMVGCDDDSVRVGPDPSEEFFKLHGGAFDQEGVDLVEFNEGFVLLGTTNTPSRGQRLEMYIVETDQKGNNIHTLIVSPEAEDADGIAHSIIRSRDGGFLMCGTIQHADSHSDIWVVKANEALEVFEQYTFGSPETDEMALAIKEGEDGSVYVLGSTSQVDPVKGAAPPGVVDGMDVYLLKLSSGLQQIWSKTYGYTGRDEGADLEILENGQLLILGTTDFPDNGGLDKDVLLIHINEEGNPINTRTYGTSGIHEVASRFEVVENQVFITGAHSPTQGNNSDVLFLSVDANLEPISGPLGINTTAFTHGFDIKPVLDGSGRFLISGTGDTEDNAREDILILTVSDTGQDLNGPKFIGNNRDDKGAAVLIQDENLVLIGTTQYLSNTMMTLLKFEVDGDL